MSKRFNPFRSPIVALILATIINGSAIIFISFLSKYRHLHNRYYFLGVLIILLLTLVINYSFLMGYAKSKKFFRVVFVMVAFFLSVVYISGLYVFFRGEGSLNQIINSKGTEYSEYHLVSFDETLTPKKLTNETVAMVADNDFLQEVNRDLNSYSRGLKIVSYPNNLELFRSLRNKEDDLYLIPKEYRSMIDDQEVLDELKEANFLLEFKKEQTEDFSSVDVVNQPFTVLLLGNNDGLSDSIIVASINPKTLKATMTSLARDSYVPMACSQYGFYDKLNHARASSRQCIVDTIENMLDIEIDFYFETDFYALVKMVDALGGLELESPVSFSGSLPKEDNPDEFEAISISEGKYLMNGKEVITFARERKHMPNGDFDRQLNQQYVIQELANKVLASRNINTMLDLLDIAKDNMTMNIPLRSINVLGGYAFNQAQVSPVDVMDTFRVVKTQVAGSTPNIDGMSVVVPYETDIEFTSKVINENLDDSFELKEFKYFTYSYASPYKLQFYNPDFAGTPGSEGISYTMDVPNFSQGWLQSEVIAWAQKRNVNVRIHETNKQSDNPIVAQSPMADEYIAPIKDLDIYIAKGVEKLHQVPNFVEESNWTEADINAWGKTNNIDITIYYDDSDYPKNTVLRQSIPAGTDLDSVFQMSVTIQL